jgi:pimeloyl-ACP methyl ester carboxylesterase
MIYFGGNSEAIENNIVNFEADLSDYSVYLIHYRGYGKSEGKPTEDGLYSDALAIYDAIKEKYESISSMGRSLGSGVAVYLAAHREIDKLILLTPYDSIVKVAQVHYPFVPAHYVARDRFEAFQYAPGISASVLIVTAELDRVVPVERGLKLREYFSPEQVTYKMIPSAAHNNITEFEEYRQLLKRFVASP